MTEQTTPIYDAVANDHGDPTPIIERPAWTQEAAEARFGPTEQALHQMAMAKPKKKPR